jgi:hypothetical protein
MKTTIPEAALAQHVAILGKTGAGKTATGKLLVEQVVGTDARVCILDTVKSDWWGLTSSADGKKPGLPFHILGGPRGHVPLHSSAGKAIAEIVASGALRHSIIDMADFEAGGAQRFFVDFAPALLRHMRGVLYLVMEEAHELAPKERAGFGAENMAIHYAKKLATAGRSKGIRLVVLTQRTQSLHNALLGSCDTLIAHRFTAPADQEPVVKWLKSNLAPDLAKEVAASLSSLKTGEGWLCAGEAKIFERRQFPRIHTYDNSATPTDDAHAHEVKTAPVDPEKLRAIIGDAVKEAEANDPAKLRAELARVRHDLANAIKNHSADLTADPQALADEYKRGRRDGFSDGNAAAHAGVADHLTATLSHLQAAVQVIRYSLGESQKAVEASPKAAPQAPDRNLEKPLRPSGTGQPAAPAAAGTNGQLSRRAERMALTVLAHYPQGRTKTQLAVIAGYAVTGGGFNNALGTLRSAGYIEGSDQLRITRAGLQVLGPVEPLPRGRALLDYWMRQLDRQAERKVLEALIEVYPRTLSKAQLAARAGYEAAGGGFNNALGKLRTLELVKGRGEMKASEDLFG